MFSGKEIIYVDEDIVSQKRCFGNLSTHLFSHQGKNYKVRLAIRSELRGELECQVYQGLKLIASENKAYSEDTSFDLWKTVGGLFAIGLVAGIGLYTMGYWIGYLLAS